MKELIKKLILKGMDLLLLPVNFVFFGIWKVVRHYGMPYFPLQRRLIRMMGILPVPDHYYQPRFVYPKDFDPEKGRDLGIDWDLEGQLKRLETMKYREELSILAGKNSAGYYYQNWAYEEGDADLYYLMIRNYKPKRIIEIGSGHSTRVAHLAMAKNAEEGIATKLICIEPYENPWLEQISGVEIIRKRVEEVDLKFFDQLEAGDFLFIDSSHVIRPGNDVLFIYQHILPRIKQGVLIHVHDIFSPRHYPKTWTHDDFRIWDEQYLLEVMMQDSKSYGILFSLNHFCKSQNPALKKLFISLRAQSNPSAFWLHRNHLN